MDMTANMQVRSKNGFDHVRMVTTEESFWIVQDLYNFTEEALRQSGTGRREDLQNWYKADYPERYVLSMQKPCNTLQAA